jgi:hypothetical protein
MGGDIGVEPAIVNVLTFWVIAADPFIARMA